VGGRHDRLNRRDGRLVGLLGRRRARLIDSPLPDHSGWPTLSVRPRHTDDGQDRREAD
jgi:hypothetical protein